MLFRSVMTTNFTSYATNVVTFSNLGVLSNISTVIDTNTYIEIVNDSGYGTKSKVNSIDSANNTITLEDYLWLTFGNVAVVTANAGSNTININTYTGQYDLINNGNYTNINNKLQDIVFVGDTISVNNEIKVVQSVGNNSLVLTTNMTDDANTYLSVQRNFIANTSLLYDQIKIYGFVGQPYNNPELMTEDGIIITTEDGKILIVG